MTVSIRSLCTLLLAAMPWLAAAALGDEPEPKKAAEAVKGDESGWQKLFREMAADYEIVAAEKTPRKFALRPAPVLRWSQPVRGGDDGAVYIWHDEGRPAVIGSIFAWPDSDGSRHVVHEMHALTPGPMRAAYKGRQVWALEKPALEFKRVPGANAPAPLAAQRLTQMRSLGREFMAWSTDRDGREWELRLLAQPLFRYELKDHPEILDGAILAFVQGTDPEILLVLEARRDGDKPHWAFSLARFSDLKLLVKHNDTEVWRVANSTFEDREAPYFARDVERRMLTDGGERKKVDDRR